MRTGQISGIGNELAAEIVARNYEMVKSGSLKIKIESKPDFKTRFGRSPIWMLPLARLRQTAARVGSYGPTQGGISVYDAPPEDY